MRLTFLAAAAAAALLAPLPALAGGCPDEHKLTRPRAIEDAPDVGVLREILATVRLKDWRGTGDLLLRTRRLIVLPGGIVPTHQHDDRPSIVTVIIGEITEHSAFCAVPILHRTGETSPEFGRGHAHWWENRSSQPVILISSDVVPNEMMEDPHM
jgi:quercetin dioxygenase-like cupin family protein